MRVTSIPHSFSYSVSYNYNNVQSPYAKVQQSFEGNKLYHDIKRDLIKEDEFESLAEETRKEDRFMGSLPKEWILKFKKGPSADSIKENTEKAYEVFAEFTELAAKTPLRHSFACKYQNTGLYEDLKDRWGGHYLEPAKTWRRNIKLLQRALQEIFDDECTVKFIDDANYGMIFKITIGGKACALKTYYPEGKKKIYTDPKGHGALLEIRNAIHSSNTMKASQTSRFYCAKIPVGSETDGFMLTSYEEFSREKVQATKQRMQWFTRNKLYWGRFTFEDAHEENFINGKLIDFGAVEYTFSSRKTQKMAKEFFTLVSQGNAKAVKEFEQKHKNEPEFEECMYHLEEYMGTEEDFENLEAFAKHCYSRKLTKKMITSFEALGADYSKLKDADFSKIRIARHREHLEKLFGKDNYR